MPHKTQHSPDDEPLRNTLAKAVLPASHTLDNVMASPPPHLPTCWLRYASSASAIALWPTASITSLASLLSSLSPPTERLFIASLCRSLCGAYIARPTHFRSRVLRFLAICLSRHNTLSRCAWKAAPNLANTYFLVFLSPHTKLGGQVTVGRSGSSCNLTLPHICFPPKKTTRCSVSIIVLFFHT